MYLKQLKITNYKSFLEPTEFNFEPGFNVLLGANSSGKTSVLEAISFNDLPATPHRSLLNVVEIDAPLTDAPTSELRFVANINDLFMLVPPAQEIYVGIGEQSDHFYEKNLETLTQRLKTEQLWLDVKADLSAGRSSRLSFENQPSMWRQQGVNSQRPAMLVRSADSIALQAGNFQTHTQDLDQIWTRIIPKIYKFSSERSVQHVYGHYQNSELLPKGENLAYCINHLATSSPDLFKRLNELIHRVFPTIHWLAAPPNGNTQFELKVHTNPTQLNRGDLAIPINRVGTGVGNALAMLYVALTAQTQRFILLEEPNSFLHPRALRELMAILAEIGGKHQFFITTHSSDVLRTIRASTVTLLEYDGQQTTSKQTTGDKLHELHAGLVDLGISLTDLHGCDKVLWVEGETEEAIFPLLLQNFFPELAQGIAVLPLHATGDFEARKYAANKVAAIYKTLSEGSFLAPPMVAIALDRERKSDSQIKQMETDCAGIVHFLPKTMLEDYLLDAEAIASVVNHEMNLQIPLEQVTETLTAAMASESCLLNPNHTGSKDVHAAKVLHFVFNQIATLEYRKTAHGPKLAEWLLANKPSELAPLKDWFNKFIQTVV